MYLLHVFFWQAIMQRNRELDRQEIGEHDSQMQQSSQQQLPNKVSDFPPLPTAATVAFQGQASHPSSVQDEEILQRLREVNLQEPPPPFPSLRTGFSLSNPPSMPPVPAHLPPPPHMCQRQPPPPPQVLSQGQSHGLMPQSLSHPPPLAQRFPPPSHFQNAIPPQHLQIPNPRALSQFMHASQQQQQQKITSPQRSSALPVGAPVTTSVLDGQSSCPHLGPIGTPSPRNSPIGYRTEALANHNSANFHNHAMPARLADGFAGQQNATGRGVVKTGGLDVNSFQWPCVESLQFGQAIESRVGSMKLTQDQLEVSGGQEFDMDYNLDAVLREQRQDVDTYPSSQGFREFNKVN